MVRLGCKQKAIERTYKVSRMRRISSSSVPMGISTSISAQVGASAISALLDVPMFDLKPATVAC
jgi:hypothetical protein